MLISNARGPRFDAARTDRINRGVGDKEKARQLSSQNLRVSTARFQNGILDIVSEIQ